MVGPEAAPIPIRVRVQRLIAMQVQLGSLIADEMAAPWSCDSVVILPDSTHDGSVLFGKNSDRPTGDCSVLVCSAGCAHAPGEFIDLGYGRVSQAPAGPPLGE